jgi:acyl dehydratase
MLDSTRNPVDPAFNRSLRHIPDQQILALNDAGQSENRMHSDAVATQYGFEGALVSGANVFAYMTQPLVNAYGGAWLDQGIMDVVFLKPAYQDNLINIRTESLGAESSQRNHLTCAFNEQGSLLAKLESWLPATMPAINPWLDQALAGESIASKRERAEISWDALEIMTPWPVHHWQPGAADNQAHMAAQRDRASVYQGPDAYLHPYLLLDACNRCLKRQFIMPAWIHTGSHLTLHRPLKAGQSISLYSLPVEKWERRGQQYLRLYIAMLVDGEVALEVKHNAIFSLASGNP